MLRVVVPWWHLMPNDIRAARRTTSLALVLAAADMYGGFDLLSRRSARRWAVGKQPPAMTGEPHLHHISTRWPDTVATDAAPGCPRRPQATGWPSPRFSERGSRQLKHATTHGRRLPAQPALLRRPRLFRAQPHRPNPLHQTGFGRGRLLGVARADKGQDRVRPAAAPADAVAVIPAPTRDRRAPDTCSDLVL